MCTEKTTGARADPCGTPAVTGNSLAGGEHGPQFTWTRSSGRENARRTRSLSSTPSRSVVRSLTPRSESLTRSSSRWGRVILANASFCLSGRTAEELRVKLPLRTARGARSDRTHAPALARSCRRLKPWVGEGALSPETQSDRAPTREPSGRAVSPFQ